MLKDPQHCCPETCCFTDIAAARHCLGNNITEMHQEWCGYFPTAESSAQCWLGQDDNITGHMFCTPFNEPYSSAGRARAGRFTWLASLLTIACWLAVATAKPQQNVKRDISLGIYKGKDNFMYYSDGVRVNWAELSSSHAQGYQDIRNSSSIKHIDRVKHKHTLHKRDKYYVRAGDGNPHQNYKFQQVSPTFTCAEHECSVTQQYSVTTGWTADVGGAMFASLGFSVSDSRTDGTSYTCSSKSFGRTCVWHQTDLTAYTATEHDEYCFGGFVGLPCRVSGPIRDVVMFAPNKHQCGLTWHCREGSDCAYESAEYYVKCGPAGDEDCSHRENEDGWGGDQYFQLPGGC